MWLAGVRLEIKKNQEFWNNQENSKNLGISDHAPRIMKRKEFRAISDSFSALDLAEPAPYLKHFQNGCHTINDFYLLRYVSVLFSYWT